MTFEVHHHARMLGDTIRLEAYSRALRSVIQPEDNVVDAGTGTAVLAAMAARHTSGRVVGIEYLSDTARFAKSAVEASGIRNLEIICGNVLQTQLPFVPEVVVTETIGALGPEENIVGICHTLLARYPSIRSFIPSRLRVLASPLSVLEARSMRAAVIGAYRNAGDRAQISFLGESDEVEEALGKMIFNSPLISTSVDEQVLETPVVLADYELGRSANPAITAQVFASGFDAVHIWFEAELSAGNVLSSSRTAPLTHWGHSYVIRPQSKTMLTLHYTEQSRTFIATWS